MKRMLITTLFAALMLGGCNTLEGVGKDIKKAGSTVEDAAKKK